MDEYFLVSSSGDLKKLKSSKGFQSFYREVQKVVNEVLDKNQLALGQKIKDK